MNEILKSKNHLYGETKMGKVNVSEETHTKCRVLILHKSWDCFEFLVPNDLVDKNYLDEETTQEITDMVDQQKITVRDGQFNYNDEEQEVREGFIIEKDDFETYLPVYDEKEKSFSKVRWWK